MEVAIQASNRQVSCDASRESWSKEDFFSSETTRHEEEALIWAALEKLPTYDRLRKSVLKSFSDDKSKVVYKEVDVRELDMKDRREFIDRVLMVAEKDNEKLLRKIKNRMDEAGINLPTVEVRFKNLTVEADCFIGDRALPTLPNATRNMAETALGCFGIKMAQLI